MVEAKYSVEEDLLQKFIDWICPFCKSLECAHARQSNHIRQVRKNEKESQSYARSYEGTDRSPEKDMRHGGSEPQDLQVRGYSDVLGTPSAAVEVNHSESDITEINLVGLGVVTGHVFSGLADGHEAIKVVDLDLAVEFFNHGASQTSSAVVRVEKQMRTCSGAGSKAREVSVCNVDVRVGDQTVKVALVSSGHVTVTGAKSLGQAVQAIAHIRDWLEHSPALSPLSSNPALFAAAAAGPCIKTASFRAGWRFGVIVSPDQGGQLCSFLTQRFGGPGGLLQAVRTAEPGSKAHRLHQTHLHVRCQSLPSAAACLAPSRDRSARDSLYVRLSHDGSCHAPAIPVAVGQAIGAGEDVERILLAAEGRARQVSTELFRAIADMIASFQEEH